MTWKAKSTWGGQPWKERGSASQGEQAYLRAASRAIAAGERAADDPRASEASCPSRYNEEEKSYWLDAFRRRRRAR